MVKSAPLLTPDTLTIICLSGRGDKDVQEVARILEEKEDANYADKRPGCR